MTASPVHLPLALLRITAALLLIVHGIARIALDIVDDFGLFLDGSGFPLGTAIAWGITAFEILGGGILAAGVAVRWIAPLFAVQLLAGIALVHFREGWFVVGAGRNGMEYSVLLIVVFAVLAWADHRDSGR